MDLPMTVFWCAFMAPFGFAVGLLAAALLGVDLVKVVREMRGLDDCNE